MPELRLSGLVAWLGMIAAFAYLLRQGESTGTWPVATITAVFISTAALVFWKSWTGLSRLQTLLVEGRPKPMLRVIRGKLRYRGGGRNRGPLIIFKAAALSMNGQFDEGLTALEDLDVPEQLPDKDRESWELAYHATRFSCLLFSERIEEARAVFDDEILRRVPDDEVATRAMAAQLDYCEGEHIRAERTFEEIVADTRTPPAARGVFHYFLGRIYLDRDQQSKANEQFAEARALSPKTWIPAGIDALLREL